MMLLLRCAIVSLVVCTSRAFTGYTRGHCQPVPQFCRNLTNGNEYALMRVPNELNNFQLNETVEGIKHWQPLVGQCHAGLKLFLCTIYAPICVHDEKHDQLVKIRNCRSFCLRVKASCEPVLNDHNYPWPTHDAFNCSLHKDDSMCVREDFVVAATTRPPVVYEGTLLKEPLDRIKVHSLICSLTCLLIRRRWWKHYSKGRAVDKPCIFI